MMNTRLSSLSILCIVALPLISVGASAGTITGRVTDHAGRGLADARILAMAPRLSQAREGVGDSLGYFSIRDVPEGKWAVRATVMGFCIEEDSVTVTASGAAMARLVLDEVPMDVRPDTLARAAYHDTTHIATCLTVERGTLYFQGTRFTAPFHLSSDDSGILLEGRRVPAATFARFKPRPQTLSRRDTLYYELDLAVYAAEVDGARSGLTRLEILRQMANVYKASPLVSEVQLLRGYLRVTYFDIPKPRTVTVSDPIEIPQDSTTVLRGRQREKMVNSFNRMQSIRFVVGEGVLLVMNADTSIYVMKENASKVDRALQSLQDREATQEERLLLEDSLPPAVLADFDRKGKFGKK